MNGSTAPRVIKSKPCATEGCKELATTLICPQCKKDATPDPAYFHDQACFAKSWKAHKAKYHFVIPPPTVEDNYTGPAGTYDPFSDANRPWYGKRQKIELQRNDTNFVYKGKLRACYPMEPVPQRAIPSHIPLPDYAKDGEWPVQGAMNVLSVASYGFKTALDGIRVGRILRPEEIESMRVVCKLGREVLDGAAAHIKPGVTTLEIDRIVHELCMERDSYPSPLGYYRFPRSVCTSVNEVVCHGIPDARPLEEGDIINLDISLYHKGYHSDLNATYPVGNVSKKAQHLITNTRRCLDRAIAICRPGEVYREIGNVIEPTAEKAGLTVNKRYVGHGINDLFHGKPSIPHYARNKGVGEMKVGQIFTIEPMVNQGKHQDYHWPDNWTCTTADGKLSAQFEETLLITEKGVEVLTAAPGWELPEEFRKFIAKGKEVTNGNTAAPSSSS